MNRPTTTATLLIVAITLALIPASTPAALPLAQALKTGELFDRQLKNLSSLAKKDFDTEFLVTQKICQIVKVRTNEDKSNE